MAYFRYNQMDFCIITKPWIEKQELFTNSRWIETRQRNLTPTSLNIFYLRRITGTCISFTESCYGSLDIKIMLCKPRLSIFYQLQRDSPLGMAKIPFSSGFLTRVTQFKLPRPSESIACPSMAMLKYLDQNQANPSLIFHWFLPLVVVWVLDPQRRQHQC